MCTSVGGAGEEGLYLPNVFFFFPQCKTRKYSEVFGGVGEATPPSPKATRPSTAHFANHKSQRSMKRGKNTSVAGWGGGGG